MFERCEKLANFIKEKSQNYNPKIAVVLGSGLGPFADSLKDSISISYDEIPDFPKTTVKGHQGRIVIGKINNTDTLVWQGRFHYYEGHSFDTVTLPIKISKLFGIEKMILTNAAGGINTSYVPADLVYIKDHLNLTGNSPLIGKNDERFGPRFPDLSQAYSKKLNQLIIESAKEVSIEVKDGVYAGVLGPAYETPAEIHMLKTLGADLVGMSTVPEAIVANHIGLELCAISCVTNMAAGISSEKLNHDDVKDVAQLAMNKFSSLLTKLIERLGS